MTKWPSLCQLDRQFNAELITKNWKTSMRASKTSSSSTKVSMEAPILKNYSNVPKKIKTQNKNFNRNF